MKSRLMLIFVVVLCLLLPMSFRAQAPATATANSPAQAIVPRLIKFSGTLLDEQGHAMRGPVGVTFALYGQQSGGAALWMETQNIKPDAAGNYAVVLGAASANGIPQELFASGEARWLGVQVEKQPEQARVLLVSVPYALKAGDAQTLGGLPASAFALSNPNPSASAIAIVPLATSPAGSPATGSLASACAAVTSNGTATSGQVAKFTSACTIGPGLITDTGTAVGIGNATPAAKLDVAGEGSFKAPASSSPLLNVQGTGTGAGSFTVDGFGNVTVSPGSGARAQNLLQGVGGVSASSSWAGFSALNVIFGTGLYPINSARTVLYIGFIGGTIADVNNMVLYTTALRSFKITAVTPVKFKGVSNPSISLTSTSICPVQPVSATNPCIVRLDPVALSLSPLNDYYFVMFFTNDAHNASLVGTTSTSTTSLAGTFVFADDSRLTVGQSLPTVAGGTFFLIAVRSN